MKEFQDHDTSPTRTSAKGHPHAHGATEEDGATYENPWCKTSVVFPPRRILLLHDDSGGAQLLANGLRRDFPEAEVCASASLDAAGCILEAGPVDAIVLHRTAVNDAASIIRTLRRAWDLPVVVVGEGEQKGKLRAAGATAFVTIDDCLRMAPHNRDETGFLANSFAVA